MDITMLTQALTQVAATVILAIGSWAVARLVQWLGLRNAAQVTAALDGALGKAVTYGLQQTQAQIRAAGWDHPDVKSAALRAALPYAIERFPDVLKAAGVPMNDPAEMNRIVASALDRAFPLTVTAVAHSPATPPATAPNPPVNADLPAEPA